jgi:hypothetical protein
MSTPSMLLLCAGAAASLAGVWTLAGLSESSRLQATPRVVGATALGLVAEAGLLLAAPSTLRGELLLPLLFATAGVVALGVGAAKIEAALLAKDGRRVVRRASGIVAGAFFAMAAVGAASLDLSHSSLAHARTGWALMFALVGSALVVFAQRTRYAGVGLLALGQRVWVLALIAIALLIGARLTQAAPVAPSPPPAVSTIPEIERAPLPSTPAVAPPAPSIAPSVAEPAPSVSAAPAPAPTKPGELAVDAVTVRGMLEADARGGVTRRMDRLSACLADPKNQQTGSLIVKVGIDATGSVADSRAIGGDLQSSPLAACLVPIFYKMGFAAPASGGAGFEITLRVGAP